MRIFFLCLLLFASPKVSMAAPHYLMRLGNDGDTTAWLREAKVHSKAVYFAGHQSSLGRPLERVIPQNEYQARVNAFKALAKNLNSAHPLMNPLCKTAVTLEFEDSTKSSANKEIASTELKFCAHELTKKDNQAIHKFHESLTKLVLAE